MNFASFLLLSALAQPSAVTLIDIEAIAANRSAESVDTSLAKPLHTLLATVPGVRSVRSLSQDGKTLVRLELDKTADAKNVRRAIVQKLAEAGPKLKVDGAQVELRILPAVDNSFVVIAVHSDKLPFDQLAAVVQKSIVQPIKQIPFVSKVETIGAINREIRISCDADRLAQFDVNLPSVLTQLKKAAEPPPKSVGELEQLVIAVKNTQPVRLSDIAAVALGNSIESNVFATKPDSQPTRNLCIVIHAKPGETEKILKSVDDLLTKVRAELPDVQIDRQQFGPADITGVVKLPDGASFDRQAMVAQKAAQMLSQISQVRHAFVVTRKEHSEIEMLISVDAKNRDELMKSVRNSFSNMVEAMPRLGNLRRPNSHWPGDGSQIVARVFAPTLEETLVQAERLKLRLAQIPSVNDVDQSGRLVPGVKFDIDRDKCKTMGLVPNDVELLLAALQQPIEVAGLKIDEVPVYLTQLVDATPLNIQNIDAVNRATISNADGQRIPLGTIVKPSFQLQPASIYREGDRIGVVVSCNASDVPVAKVRETVRKLAKELSGSGTKVEVD